MNMDQQKSNQSLPFRSKWANLALIVTVVLACLYGLGIASSLLVSKGGGKGQTSISLPEVEESVGKAATRQVGPVRSVMCKEPRLDEWLCDIESAGGKTVHGSATWYSNQHDLRINIQLTQDTQQKNHLGSSV
jgi:hypothetical protein